MIAENILEEGAGGAGQVSQFPIKPGKQLQVIRLPERLLSAQHLYIQVSGQPSGRHPDFSSSGVQEGILKYRPDRFVPFKVPVYDEDSSLLQEQAYKKAKNDQPEKTFEKPKPVYQWAYRPELQFSIYDLVVDEIRREDADDNSQDILNDDKPVLTSSDAFLKILYDLQTNANDPLEAYSYNGDRELVFALGEQELKATVSKGAGEHQKLEFDDLSALSGLEPEDYLSLRLYTNNDAGNILWEWAFEFLDYYALIDGDILPDVDGAIEISADDPEIELIAHLPGFVNRPDDQKYNVGMRWSLYGQGVLEKRFDQDDDYAIFNNTLTMTRKAGDTAKVVAKLTLDDDQAEHNAPLYFKVVPSEPARIDLITFDHQKLYVGSDDVKVFQGTVYDAWGNTVADGTSVDVTTLGAIELIEKTKELVTKSGRFRFEVKGTDYPEAAQLEISAGEVAKTADVEVLPVTIEIEGLPEHARVNQPVDFSFKVTAGGKAARNYELDVWANNGRLDVSSIITDSSGIARATLFAPPQAGETTVKVMTAMQKPVEQVVTIQPPLNNSRFVDSHRAKLVGDSATENIYQYQRWDGLAFNVNKAIAGQLEVYGSLGDEDILKLGDAFEPNRQTLAAYWMNSVLNDEAIDETGFAPGVLENIEADTRTRLQAGRSFRFRQTEESVSRVKVSAAPRIQQQQDISFSLDILADTSKGVVLNSGNALKLELLDGGVLQLTANTTANEIDETTGKSKPFILQSNDVQLGQWQRVAVSFAKGRLALTVGDQQVSMAVSGDLIYSDLEVFDKEDEQGNPVASYYDLVLGDGYSGLLNSLKWFDLGSEPLVVFSGQTEPAEQINLSFTSTGPRTIAVKSTGLMHAAGGRLSMQNIPVQWGGESYRVTLLSSQAFEDLASVAVSSGLVAGTETYNEDYFNIASYDPSQSPLSNSLPSYASLYGQQLFPSAYAYDLDYWDVVKIAGSLIGLDSVEVIWDQLGNMLAGRDVDIVAFSVAVLDVLALIPPATALKGVTIPTKVSFKIMKAANSKSVQYLGGALKRIFRKLKNRDTSDVYQLIAFVIVLADMYSDPEAREGISVLAGMINSTDDFMDLLDYFALADDEIVYKPEEDTAFLFQNSPLQQFAGAEWGLFPQAYAATDREVGEKIGKLFIKLKPVLAKMDNRTPKMLGVLGRRLKAAKANDDQAVAIIAKSAFNADTIQAAISIVRMGGLQKLRNLLTAGNSRRIRPLMLVAIIAYLEEEVQAEQLFPPSQDDFDREHNLTELRKLYLKALPSFIKASKDDKEQQNDAKKKNARVTSDAHGASYHLMQIAFFHALSQSDNVSSLVGEVQGIEVPREVFIFEDDDDLEKAIDEDSVNAKKLKYRRYVDILLGERQSKEVWVETKSYRSEITKAGAIKETLAYPISPWHWGTGANDGNSENTVKGSNVHRQFVLDRIAKGVGAQTGTVTAREAHGVTKETLDITVDNIIWSFHKFKTRDRSKELTSQNPAIRYIYDGLLQKAKGNQSEYEDHAEIVSNTQAKGFIELGQAQLLMDLTTSSLKDAVLNDLANSGFE